MIPTSLTRQLSMSRSGLDRAISLHRKDLALSQEQLATGRRVNRASDDASAYATARAMETLENRYDQYARSIGAANYWVDSTQDALDGLADLFANAYENGIQGGTDTLNDDDRAILAEELESTLQEVLDGLNRQAGGEYLFAGTDTQTTPFVLDGAAGSDAAGVSYYGNAGDRVRAVAPGLDLAVNIPGGDVLTTDAGTTITDALQNLIDALNADDTDAIQDATAQVAEARDHLIDLGSRAGTIAERLNLSETQLQDVSLLAAQRRSEAEDADLAEVAVQLQQSQTGLQAALQVTASVRQMSLLNYL